MKVARIAYFINVVASLGFASSAFAQANMQLTGAGQYNVMAGVYTSPYTGKINGVSQYIICDDFADDTYFNETWQANVSTVANLQNPRWGSANQAEYDQAAWLAEQLLAPNLDATTMGLISFAMWDIFDANGGNPTDIGVEKWLAAYDPSVITSVHSWVAKAVSNAGSPGSYANVQVYTAIAGTAKGCGGSPGSPCPANSPQEFLVVTTPEASTPFVLAGDLLVLLAVVVLFRRRTIQATK